MQFLLDYSNEKKLRWNNAMKEIKAKMNNPLSELIIDDIYELLSSHGLIDDKSVRDFLIRKKFKHLRASKVSAGDAIDDIRRHYPYLQFDTIRKIVYQINIPIVKENKKS
jgi:hypothetical protein